MLPPITCPCLKGIFVVINFHFILHSWYFSIMKYVGKNLSKTLGQHAVDHDQNFVSFHVHL